MTCLSGVDESEDRLETLNFSVLDLNLIFDGLLHPRGEEALEVRHSSRKNGFVSWNLLRSNLNDEVGEISREKQVAVIGREIQPDWDVSSLQSFRQVSFPPALTPLLSFLFLIIQF